MSDDVLRVDECKQKRTCFLCLGSGTQTTYTEDWVCVELPCPMCGIVDVDVSEDVPADHM